MDPNSAFSAVMRADGGSNMRWVAGGREEIHVDARDLLVSELDVARAGAVVAGRLALAADPGDQLVCHHARRTLGKHPGLRVPTLITSPTA